MNTTIETIQVPAQITEKWQEIIDLLAEVLHVPSALIMKVESPNIRVFLRSESEGNPYEKDECACLDTGLYCETVMKTRQLLLVPDALADQEWNANPDIKLGMISYMGVPVAWPNGDIFGTICVLDARPNGYNELYRKLLFQCREVLQADLKSLQASTELELKVLERTAQLRRSVEQLHKVQTELAHATRVTTLGELTASIAHEVSQPLAAMSLNATAGLCCLDGENPDLSEARDALRAIIMDGNRANDVIRRVRALAKMNDIQKMPLDINEVIEEVMLIFRQEALSHGVSLSQELASALPQVLGDRVQLQQVLMNLLMNGIQATSAVAGRRHELRIRSQAHGRDHILVAVEDTGSGIEPQNVDRLFSAFFTTKPDGLGIGLSICRSIVEQHGGKIWGDIEFRGGQHVSVYVARAWGGATVAPGVKTQCRVALRCPGSWWCMNDGYRFAPSVLRASLDFGSAVPANEPVRSRPNLEERRICEESKVSMMKLKSSGCAAAILMTGLCWAGTAAAQTAADRAVELFTCKDVMREPNTSREVAIAFLHGYLLGKSGGSKFNVEALEKQTSAFIEQCLDNPKDNAADVMAKLKK